MLPTQVSQSLSCQKSKLTSIHINGSTQLLKGNFLLIKNNISTTSASNSRIIKRSLVWYYNYKLLKAHFIVFDMSNFTKESIIPTRKVSELCNLLLS